VQWEIVFGWGLQDILPVTLERLRQWILANFDVDVSLSSISKHLKEMGMSFQLTGARAWRQGLTHENYVRGYFDFVKKLRDTGFFLHDQQDCVHRLCDQQSSKREIDHVEYSGRQAEKIFRVGATVHD
jgi:hypothetical protein